MADDKHPDGLSPFRSEFLRNDPNAWFTPSDFVSSVLAAVQDEAPVYMLASDAQVPSLRHAFSEHGRGCDVRSLGTPRGLQGDGWTRSQASNFVRLETPVRAGSAAYVRTLSTPGHPRVGTFRGDADGGTCERVRGFRFDYVQWQGSTDIAPPISVATVTSKTWCATLAQIDGRKGWHRHEDSGFISARRAASGRYDERAPTNRKRKRERCKARRRLRLGPRLSDRKLAAARKAQDRAINDLILYGDRFGSLAGLSTPDTPQNRAIIKAGTAAEAERARARTVSSGDGDYER